VLVASFTASNVQNNNRVLSHKHGNVYVVVVADEVHACSMLSSNDPCPGLTTARLTPCWWSLFVEVLYRP